MTLTDLADDFAEISILSTSARKRLSEHLEALMSQRAAYIPATYEYLLKQAQDLAHAYDELKRTLDETLAQKSQWSADDSVRLRNIKRSQTELLRVLQSSLGATITAGNWQAPSFAQTHWSEAGNRTGRVTPNLNDYTRDFYPAEDMYGQLLTREYVDHPTRLPPQTMLTSSCMAALTTVLANACGTMGPQEKILVGATSYFQNRWIAEKMFPGRVMYVDEFDTEGILAAAQEHQPAVILLDSIAGTESLAMPHLERLIPELSKILTRKSMLVIDITATATLYQPLRYVPLNPFGLQVVLIASLSKYYQYGLDRVTAGAIWAPFGIDLTYLQTRRNAGTILPEASLYALPMPCRPILDMRLRRIERNARTIAERLDEFARTVDGPVSYMVYPSLASYRGYQWSKDAPFHGGVCTFVFKPGFETASYQEKFAERLFAAAKKNNIELIGGAGFGYNTTRLYYLTKAISGPLLKPFVRIAAGTETTEEVDRMVEAFKSVVGQH